MVLGQAMLQQPGTMQAAENIKQSLVMALITRLLPRICVQLGAQPDQHRPIWRCVAGPGAAVCAHCLRLMRMYRKGAYRKAAGGVAGDLAHHGVICCWGPAATRAGAVAAHSINPH